jgi:hypothetical protein
VGDGVIDEAERRVRAKVRGGHKLVGARWLGFCLACANALGMGVGARWRVGHRVVDVAGGRVHPSRRCCHLVGIWVNALASRSEPKKVK